MRIFISLTFQNAPHKQQSMGFKSSELDDTCFMLRKFVEILDQALLCVMSRVGRRAILLKHV